MEDTVFHRLVADIEAVKARQSIHEAECALRYGRIEEHTQGMRGAITSMDATLRGLANQANNAAWSANWKAWVIAATIGGILLSALVWTSSQLYALEPLRVKQATMESSKR